MSCRRGFAAAAQLGEAMHVADRHAGWAQALQEGQPREVVGVVAPLAAVNAGDRIEEGDGLVVAQRVGRQPRQRGDRSLHAQRATLAGGRTRAGSDNVDYSMLGLPQADVAYVTSHETGAALRRRVTGRVARRERRATKISSTVLLHSAACIGAEYCSKGWSDPTVSVA